MAMAFQMSLNRVYQVGLVRLSHQSLAVFLVGSLAVIVGQGNCITPPQTARWVNLTHFNFLMTCYS